MQSFQCSPREYPYLCARNRDFVYLNSVFLFSTIHSFLMKLIFFVSACYYKNVLEYFRGLLGEKLKKKNSVCHANIPVNANT